MGRFFVLVFSSVFLFACQDKNRQTSLSASTNELDLSGRISTEKAQLDFNPLEFQNASFLAPSPGEVFSALDKLENVDWSLLASYNSNILYDDDYKRSLNLGIRIADAIVAIYARDAKHFGEMNEAIFSLASELGLSDAMIEKKAYLSEMVELGKWESLNVELDNVHHDIQAEVEEMGDDELITLTGVGGWLEGLRVTSDYLASHYNRKQTDILNQGKLISYYLSQMDKLSTQSKEHPLVIQVNQSLGEISEILPDSAAIPELSQEKVHKLSIISKGITEEIEELQLLEKK